MNKKDLSAMKKEFKLESVNLTIQQVYSVYLKREDKTILHKEVTLFGRKDDDEQELFFNNFKKILTGNIDSKIFELDFNMENEGKVSQTMLYSATSNKSSESLEDLGDEIVKRISDNCEYDTDVVITLIRGTYNKPAKKKKKGDLDELESIEYAFDFIMGSINKVTPVKKALRFNFNEKEFETTSSLDTIINTSAPLDGFMFPSICDNSADVNKVMYYTSKADSRNEYFMDNVLNCSYTLTAKEEKNKFEELLKSVIGEKVTAETMKTIYEDINIKAELDNDGEPATLGVKDIERVLQHSGVQDTSRVSEVFEDLVGQNYNFKASNIVPSYNSKTLKLENDVANITICPKDLGNIRQVIDASGRKCLLIEIGEDIVINGMSLMNEKL